MTFVVEVLPDNVCRCCFCCVSYCRYVWAMSSSKLYCTHRPTSASQTLPRRDSFKASTVLPMPHSVCCMAVITPATVIPAPMMAPLMDPNMNPSTPPCLAPTKGAAMLPATPASDPRNRLPRPRPVPSTKSRGLVVVYRMEKSSVWASACSC